MIVKITFQPDLNDAPLTEMYECHNKADEDSIPYGAYTNIISIEEISL